jgi:hypothetical protein
MLNLTSSSLRRQTLFDDKNSLPRSAALYPAPGGRRAENFSIRRHPLTVSIPYLWVKCKPFLLQAAQKFVK